ncbi:MAG: GntR family transcriptional regulator [Kiritimatiellae bacterium]|nr:GntR family transcriptional regulator [Kiritimatiellia bacterium]
MAKPIKAERLKHAAHSEPLQESLRESIRGGTLKAGDRLPAENELAKEARISVYWVRKAIRNLKKEGLLVSRPKSGVYVASPGEEPPTAEADPSATGFSFCHILHATNCRIEFLVSGWNAHNRADWVGICAEASRRSPDIEVHPCFPANAKEYFDLLKTCDVFLTVPTFVAGDPRCPEIQPLALREIEALPVDGKYRRAVLRAGDALGIPLTGTLLTGLLDPGAVPAAERVALASSQTWEEAFGILADMQRKRPDRIGTNLAGGLTYNGLFNHLVRTAGCLVDVRSGRIRLGDAAFRSSLRQIDAFRNKAFAPGNTFASKYHPDQFYAPLVRTWLYGRNPSLLANGPWLYPVGRNGAHYEEGINVGAINRATSCPEECLEFLRYLASPSVQERLAMRLGEHPLSNEVPDRFAAYPKRWKRHLCLLREQSEVFHEVVPGYSWFVGSILVSVATQFMRGDIPMDVLIERVGTEGKLYLAECAGKAARRQRVSSDI